MLENAKEKIKSLEKRECRIKFLKELGCIAFGTIVGLATYVACLYANLAIFGWNIGLALAPLFAGYAESQTARIFVKESTGAVSAFIIFIVTVIYGFIISNPTLGFNIITAGSIVIIIQAAIPTATNYFLISMGLAIISHISGIFKKITKLFSNIYGKIFRKEGEEKENHPSNSFNKDNLYNSKLEMNKLGVILLTLEYPPKGLIIKDQKEIYESRHVFGFNQREQIKSGIEDSLDDEVLSGVRLAHDKALLKLIKQIKADGCNGLMNLNVTFETLGSNKGENLSQVVMKGTGVIFEEEEDVSDL